MTGEAIQRAAPVDLAEIRKWVAAAADSLDLIGDGDWTPQDLHLARMVRFAGALVERLEAAEEAIRKADAHLADPGPFSDPAGAAHNKIVIARAALVAVPVAEETDRSEHAD